MSKVHIRHFRNITFNIDLGFHYSNHGGATVLSEQIGENTFQIGVSICNRDDNFCKATGRKFAMSRLIKNPITVTREEMQEILEEDNVYSFYLAAEPLLNSKGLTAKKAFA